MSVTTDNFEYCNAIISNFIPAYYHSTRFTSNNKCTIHAYNKTVSQNKFLYNAIKIWNLLPQSVNDIQE